MTGLERAARAIWDVRRRVDPTMPALDESQDPEFYLSLLMDEARAVLRVYGIDPDTAETA